MTSAPASEAIKTSRHFEPPPRKEFSGGGMSLRALWTLYALTLRQHLRGKRWLIMGVLFLLPAGLALVIRATAPTEVPRMVLEFIFGFMFIPQALLPLVALVYASGMIQDEQEEQTLTYLLIRPIPKWALYAVKLLATTTTAVALTMIFTALTYVAIYAGDAGGTGHPDHIPLRALKAASIHGLSVIAYCSLFGLMSLLTKRTLVLGIIYAVIFEGFLANLPMSVRLLTVIYYARIIAYRTMAFPVPTPEGVKDIAADGWQLDVANDPTLTEHPTLGTCLKVLLIGSVACTIVAAFACSRREFYVKTPDKS